MSQKINTNKFLKNVRIGLWRIEVEEGKLPRFYADEVMDELLGITEEITPEERFAFHRRCAVSYTHLDVYKRQGQYIQYTGEK